MLAYDADAALARFASLDTLREACFFERTPLLAARRMVLSAWRRAAGVSPASAVRSDFTADRMPVEM